MGSSMLESSAKGRANGSGIVRPGTPLRDEVRCHSLAHGNCNGSGSMPLLTLTRCGENAHVRQAIFPIVVTASCQRKWRRPVIVQQDDRMLHPAQADFGRFVLRADALQCKGMFWVATRCRCEVWDGWNGVTEIEPCLPKWLSAMWSTDFQKSCMTC